MQYFQHMKTSPPQRRRIPANVWSAARAVYVGDQSLSLATLAERFGLPVHALKRRCSRQRWLYGPEKSIEGENGTFASESVVRDVPKLETAADFREALREEAKAWLLLLRNARLRAGGDAVTVAKSITPLLGKLARIADKAFAEEPKEEPEEKCSVNLHVFTGASSLVEERMAKARETAAAADVQA